MYTLIIKNSKFEEKKIKIMHSFYFFYKKKILYNTIMYSLKLKKQCVQNSRLKMFQ